MESLFALVGFLIVSAITPGPNNVIVLTAARRGGLIGALSAILGVIIGSLVLLVLVWLGAAIAVDDVPSLAPLLAFMGACYVASLGFALLYQASRRDGSDGSHHAGGLPSTAFGLAVFQLLNPKAWGLIATAVASHTSLGFLVLAALILLICTTCLLLWAWCGSAIAGFLEDGPAHRWLNRLWGLLLLASAALLLFGA